MKKLLLAATALSGFLAFTCPASAADPVIEHAYDWSGFYVGVFGGYAFGDFDVDGDDGAFDEAGSETFDLDPEDAAVGLTAGYNWQADQFVFGLEGEIGYNFAGDEDDDLPDDNFAEVDYGIYGTLAARLGWAFNNLLLYGKAGGALAEIDNRAGDLVGASTDRDPTDLGKDDQTAFGLLLGAGAEFGWSENWSIKAEYNYMAFEDGDDTNEDGDDFDFENDMHLVKIGVNFAL